jgi:hypothetical protein
MTQFLQCPVSRSQDARLFDRNGRETERALVDRDERIIGNLEDWRLDVREADDVTLFTLLFSDIRLDHIDPGDLMPSEELPNSEALWSRADRLTTRL